VQTLAFSVSVVKGEFNLEVQQYIVCRFAPEIALPALAKVPLPGFAPNGAISLSYKRLAALERNLIRLLLL